MTTKGKISEQIQRLYSRFKGERENATPVFDKRELYELINQSINKALSVQTLNSFKEGNIEVPSCNIILYKGITVNSDHTSYASLPVFPIKLPMEMGVWEVTQANNPLNPFIPVPMEYAQLIQGTIVSALEQKVGYYVEAGSVTSGLSTTPIARVRFLTDISATYPTVDMRLLVSDISTLDAADYLPLSADLEAVVIADVLSLIGVGQVSLAELQSQINNGTTD